MQPKVKGRGAGTNLTGRFEDWTWESVDDGWHKEQDDAPVRTTVQVDSSKTVIVRNQSPDLPFDRSVNMYRGCEHGCIYCYARPTHTYLGYSAGLDFETKLLMKPDVAEKLRIEISKPSYRCGVLALGTNTDPYQPIEREHQLTRQILEVLLEHRHPVTITTKSGLIVRDADILAEMASMNLASVNMSVTTLDPKLSRTMEPRATAPHKRVETIRRLSMAGVPVMVLVAPIIPGLNDHEIEKILKACADAGAGYASWTMLRLPLEVRDLFIDWLEQNYPDKAKRVKSLVRGTRNGQDSDSEFFSRMRGTGNVAELTRSRFNLSKVKFNLDKPFPALDVSQFRKHVEGPVQASLF